MMNKINRKTLLAGAALLLAAPLMATDVKLTVVTPSRTQQNIADVPASVDVILPEQLKAAPGETLDQKLQNLVPGMVATRSAGLYSQSGTLSMRGFSGQQDTGARVLVMIDGVQLNSSATGGVIWNDLVFADIERIEVVKGAGSSVYGANAMAGVVNIITKSKKGYELNASYGTYNTYRAGARAGFDLGKWFMEVNANTLQSDGYKSIANPVILSTHSYSKAEIDMKQAGAKARYAIDENHRLTLGYNYSERYNGEELEVTTVGKTNYRQNNTHIASAKYEGKTQSDVDYNFGGYYKNVYYEKLQGRKDNIAKVNRQDYAINSALAKNYESLMLTAGFDALNGAVFGNDYKYTTGAHTAIDYGKRYNIAPFVQAQKKFAENRISLLLGLRYDYAGFYDGYSKNSSMPGSAPAEWKTGKNLEDKHWGEISPKIALNYKYADSISQYISWSRGFNAPALENMVLVMWRGGRMQLPNEDLQPETADTIETGFSVNPVQGLFIEPSIYYTKVKDYVYTSFFKVGTVKYRQYQNLGEAQIYGAEIPVKYQIGSLGLQAAYAQSHSQILDGIDQGNSLNGNTLALAPRHIWSAGISYNFPHQTQLSVNWAHKSRQWDNITNTASTAGYSTTSVALTSQVTKNVQVGISADNVFNERFLDSEDTLAPGRTITGSVKVNF